MESGNVFYATGKRKKSVAKVWLMPGTGKMTVNDRVMDDYFDIRVNRDALAAPLTLTQMDEAFDVRIDVMGGGQTGQAGAVRQGLSKAWYRWTRICGVCSRTPDF